jgi:hypothetical protein
LCRGLAPLRPTRPRQEKTLWVARFLVLASRGPARLVFSLRRVSDAAPARSGNWRRTEEPTFSAARRDSRPLQATYPRGRRRCVVCQPVPERAPRGDPGRAPGGDRSSSSRTVRRRQDQALSRSSTRVPRTKRMSCERTKIARVIPKHRHSSRASGIQRLWHGRWRSSTAVEPKTAARLAAMLPRRRRPQQHHQQQQHHHQRRQMALRVPLPTKGTRSGWMAHALTTSCYRTASPHFSTKALSRERTQQPQRSTHAAGPGRHDGRTSIGRRASCVPG